jgi:hypothetical protein
MGIGHWAWGMGHWALGMGEKFLSPCQESPLLKSNFFDIFICLFSSLKYRQIYIIVKTEIHEDNMNYLIHVFPNTD